MPCLLYRVGFAQTHHESQMVAVCVGVKVCRRRSLSMKLITCLACFRAHVSAGFNLLKMYSTCKRLQSRSASLQLCNQGGSMQLDLKASPAIALHESARAEKSRFVPPMLHFAMEQMS